MRTLVAGVVLSVIAVRPPALACHACPVGLPCLPCAEPVDLRRIVLVFTAGSDSDATRWTLRGREARIQPASVIAGIRLEGRIT